jgi:hypothetical protein
MCRINRHMKLDKNIIIYKKDRHISYYVFGAHIIKNKIKLLYYCMYLVHIDNDIIKYLLYPHYKLSL